MADKLDSGQKALVAVWYENLKSVTLVQRKFCKQFSTILKIERNNVLRYHSNLMQYGSVWVPKGIDGRGRPMTSRSSENVERVLEKLKIVENEGCHIEQF